MRRTALASKQWAERLRLDKEDDGGRWLLTYMGDASVAFRLRITVGGPWDWFCFSAESQARGERPVVLAQFDIAPIELWSRDLPRYERTDIDVWNPSDEPDFLRIPVEYRRTFEMLVWRWGVLAGSLVPAPACLTIH